MPWNLLHNFFDKFAGVCQLRDECVSWHEWAEASCWLKLSMKLVFHRWINLIDILSILIFSLIFSISLHIYSSCFSSSLSLSLLLAGSMYWLMAAVQLHCNSNVHLSVHSPALYLCPGIALLSCLQCRCSWVMMMRPQVAISSKYR